MKPWKTLSRETILDHSDYLRVENHEVLLPNGRVIKDWPWVITPDFVIVIAVTTSGDYLLFRQTKYAVDGLTLAPVGGYLEGGEDPLAAAKRELLEETGYAAAAWQSLGHFVVDGNRGAGTGYLFLASEAEKIGIINSDDLEDQELLQLPRQAVEAAIDAGEIKLMPWITAVMLALRLDYQRANG